MPSEPWSAGLNWFDTANMYSIGASEEILGNALKRWKPDRDELVIQTKVNQKMGTGPNRAGSSRKAIMSEIDHSLKRLQLDYVDVYILHRWDWDTPIEETMEAMNDVVKTGKARYIGASAMFAWQFEKAYMTAKMHGWANFITMQNHLNLLYREDEREMIPVCRQYDMALTPYSPLASGHLCRPTWDSDSVRSRTDQVMVNKYDGARDNDMKIVARVAEVAERHEVPMSRVALAWHWARGVEAPIVGCSRPERVDDAVAALDVELSAEELAYLEEPYVAHELVGPLGRPGEKPLAGTTDPNAK